MKNLILFLAVLVGCSGEDEPKTSTPEPAECRDPGVSCDDDEESCCDGSTCVHDVMTDAGTCAATCTEASDCVSGCCEELVDSAGAVCAPAEYCASACLNPGGDCTGNPAVCCPGNTCVNTGEGVSICSANCVTNVECNSDCCAPLESGGRVCAPPAICAP